MLFPVWWKAVLPEDWQNGGFGLYLHWPFCEAKCPYCDFNSHVSCGIDHMRWKDAYLSEIDRHAQIVPNRVLNSVFFGGGTPSLMQPEVVAALLERIRASWPLANDLEVTLEANPGSVEAGRFAAYADAGISRISMGIQALNDTDLRRLGRLHSVEEAKQAFDIARKYFGRVSFDMIYARQDQSPEAWRRELGEALAMAVDHLSLYQLTIEPGTAFGDRFARGGLHGLPDEDLSAEMYEITQSLCDAAGLTAYEVSNHAKGAAESRHNLIYWRYGDYAGIGPGAHGRLTVDGIRRATASHSLPDLWLAAAENGNGDKLSEPISIEDQTKEFLMMGLRLNEGIDASRYQSISFSEIPSRILRYLEELGLLRLEQNRIRTTKTGRLLLNSVIRELLSAP